jgi:uroporphyrinogen-III synthase
MPMTSLRKLTILNTRAKEQAKALSDFIVEHGGKSIELPVLKITMTPGWKRFVPSECDIALFTSQNAARITTDFLSSYWSHHPTIIAIGKQTAGFLDNHGFPSPLTPTTPSSEGLLKAPILQQVAGKHIIIVKGHGGRVLLKQTLEKRYALVTELNAYQRLCPLDIDEKIKNQWKNNPIDIILGTSVEAVKNTFQLFDTSEHQRLKDTPWLVISPRIKQTLLSLGTKQVVVARKGDIYQTLLNWNTLNG